MPSAFDHVHLMAPILVLNVEFRPVTTYRISLYHAQPMQTVQSSALSIPPGSMYYKPDVNRGRDGLVSHPTSSKECAIRRQIERLGDATH